MREPLPEPAAAPDEPAAPPADDASLDGDPPYVEPDEPARPDDPWLALDLQDPPPRSPPQPSGALEAQRPLVVERNLRAQRVTHVPGRPLVPARSPAEPGPEARPGRREYPKMLALLRDPEGLDPGPGQPAPPVPNTFVPTAAITRAQRARRESASAEDLDGMLRTMAEGLLVGGDARGAEVRVTLRDEFFQGTELRIAIEEGLVHAQLEPPTLEVYRVLEAESHRLRAQLEQRGLRVARVSVVRP